MFSLAPTNFPVSLHGDAGCERWDGPRHHATRGDAGFQTEARIVPI